MVNAFHTGRPIPGSPWEQELNQARYGNNVIKQVDDSREYFSKYLRLPDIFLASTPKLDEIMVKFDATLNRLKEFDAKKTPEERRTKEYRDMIQNYREQLQEYSRQAGFEIYKQVIADMNRPDGIVGVLSGTPDSSGNRIRFDHKRDGKQLQQFLQRIRLPKDGEKQDKTASLWIGRGDKRTLDVGELRNMELWINAVLDNKKKTVVTEAHKEALLTLRDTYIPLLRMTDSKSYAEHLAAGGGTGKQSEMSKMLNRSVKHAGGVGLGILAVLSGLSNPGHISTVGFTAGSLWAFGFFDGHNKAAEVVRSDAFVYSLDAFKGSTGRKLAQKIHAAREAMLPIPRTPREEEKGVKSSSFKFHQAMDAWRDGKVTTEQMADWFQLKAGHPARANFFDLVSKLTDVDSPSPSKVIRLLDHIHGLPKDDFGIALEYLKKEGYKLTAAKFDQLEKAQPKI